MGIIMSDEMFGQMEDYYGHVFNTEFAKLERTFAWVETLPIHQVEDKDKKTIGDHFIIISEDGYICEVDENSPTGWDLSRQAFQESWWYKWVYAFQDVAKGKNIAKWSVITPTV